MEVLIEKFKKSTDGTWTLSDYRTVDSLFTIETINYQTTLTEIYRDVLFDETEGEDWELTKQEE